MNTPPPQPPSSPVERLKRARIDNGLANLQALGIDYPVDEAEYWAKEEYFEDLDIMRVHLASSAKYATPVKDHFFNAVTDAFTALQAARPKLAERLRAHPEGTLRSYIMLRVGNLPEVLPGRVQEARQILAEIDQLIVQDQQALSESRSQSCTESLESQMRGLAGKLFDVLGGAVPAFPYDPRTDWPGSLAAMVTAGSLAVGFEREFANIVGKDRCHALVVQAAQGVKRYLQYPDFYDLLITIKANVVD